MAQLIITLCLFSCNQSNNDEVLDIGVRVVDTDFNPLKDLQDSIDYQFRLNFETFGDTVKIFGVLKNGNPFVYNSHKPLKKYIACQLDHPTNRHISLSTDAMIYFSEENNSIASIDDSRMVNETLFEEVLDQNEYIIGPLYSQNAFRFVSDSLIFVQVGTINESINLISDNLFKVFSSDSIYYCVKPPDVLLENYYHYNDVDVVFHDSFIYLTFPTLDHLFKYELSGDLIGKTSIPGNYVSFDFEKVTNPLYIHDYTYETSYNLKLLELGDNKIGLVQRMAVDEYYVHYFTKSQLKYIGYFKIPFNPYYYYISSDVDTIVFGIPHLNELHKIYLSDDL